MLSIILFVSGAPLIFLIYDFYVLFASLVSVVWFSLWLILTKKRSTKIFLALFQTAISELYFMIFNFQSDPAGIKKDRYSRFLEFTLFLENLFLGVFEFKNTPHNFLVHKFSRISIFCWKNEGVRRVQFDSWVNADHTGRNPTVSQRAS